MVIRYLKVYKKQVALLVLIGLLIYFSSVTKGTTAKVLAVIAGLGMIYLGVYFLLWILKTPTKSNTDEGA